MNVRGHTNSVLWMHAVCWLRKVTLIQFSQRIFWTNCVHLWYGVCVTAYSDFTELMWQLCDRVKSWYGVDVYTVYCTVGFIWRILCFFCTKHRVDRVLGFFSSRPNWDSPAPSTAGECVPPPPLVGGGGGDTLACGWGDHFTELKWPHKVTLRSQKNQHEVTLTSQSDFKSY
jgi:hypothetical protein